MFENDNDLFCAWVKRHMKREGVLWMQLPEKWLDEEQQEAVDYYWAQSSMRWDVI